MDEVITSENLKIQHAVTREVIKRGYHNGWSERLFMARQICKLLEKLAELAKAYGKLNIKDDLLDEALHNMGSVARDMLNDRESWVFTRTAAIDYGERMKEALTDLQVVLFSIAETISRITEKPFDLVGAALEKAQQDVKRGVR